VASDILNHRGLYPIIAMRQECLPSQNGYTGLTLFAVLEIDMSGVPTASFLQLVMLFPT